MQKRIASTSIDLVKSASIAEVVGYFLPLKKAGANLTACCPFHSEKSPSFIVSPAKDIYKCFGCGAGGDAIRFVMEHEKLDFIKAVETVASITGINLEFEEREPTQKEIETISAAEAQEKVLDYVIPIYRQQLHQLPADHPVKQYLHGRGITDEAIVEWQLGWASTDWHFITPSLVNKEWFQPANKLGIIKQTKTNDTPNNNNGTTTNLYDGYRSRITIPIIDRMGHYVGMAGRYIEIEETDKGKAYPKYINPADCELYNKSTVLFGLNRAQKAIKEKGCAILVEGNFDVITPHLHGVENVVGTSGTAFTKQQMQQLKKHTNKLVLMFDNDDAGAKAFNRSLPELLAIGFQVEKANYEGKDPDEFFNVIASAAKQSIQTDDALLYRCRQLMEDAADDIHKKSEAKTIILELIAHVSNEIIRSNYFDTIVKKYKWNRNETKSQFESISSRVGTIPPTGGTEGGEGLDSDSIKLPDWLNEDQREQFLQQGYLPINRKNDKGKPVVGYYSFNQNGKQEITNFTVDPLFHVYAGVESRYLLQISNGWRKAVLDVPAKSIPSIDQFQAFTVSEGNFLIFGGKAQWLRIASDLLQKFPRCIELKNLGWQPAGFFAYVDKIFTPGHGLSELDNWGIYQHIPPIGGTEGGATLPPLGGTEGGKGATNYLIPASCEAYRQLQQTGEDPYENDRHLSYNVSPVTFTRWAQQMHTVFHEKGTVGIAAVILSLFRDIIFDVDNNCPHIYAFGEPSSGKSKWAESITAVFFHRRSAFNLNSGTDFAFFSYMQRYRNTPAHLNEFDIEVIKPEWFQAIKGVFDGEGRERGKGGSKNRTEIMKVHSVLVLTGQKLVTADDNSVVTRSIIEPFSTKEFTDEAKQQYDLLKGWEQKGLSSMLPELLKHRSYFEAHYKESFNRNLSDWRKNKTEARTINARILQNFAHLATCYRLTSDCLTTAAVPSTLQGGTEGGLPVSTTEFTEYCFTQASRWSNFIKSSDTLSEFWRTLEFLADSQLVFEGWDYTIEEMTSIRIRKNRNEEVTQDFDQPTKVLYLRLNNVHKLFQSTYRSRTGKEAMNLENLLHYFSSRKYFLGSIKSKRFKRYVNITEEKNIGGMAGSQMITTKKPQETISSCYAFVYDELNVEIERYDGTEKPADQPTDDLPF
jgi:DNA primase